MLKIIISFIILISLTMSSAVGLVGRDTYNSTESKDTVVLDKPDVNKAAEQSTNIKVVAVEQAAAVSDLLDAQEVIYADKQSEDNQSETAEVVEGIINSNPTDKEASQPPSKVEPVNNIAVVTNKAEDKTVTVDKPEDNSKKDSSPEFTQQEDKASGDNQQLASDSIPAGPASNVSAQQVKPVKEEATNATSSSKQPVEQNAQSSAIAGSNAEYKTIDLSQVNKGLIGIRYQNTTGKKMKLMIEKDGSRYTYNLLADNTLESFSLQSGNGEYKISIMENTEGKKYKYVLTETINVNTGNAMDVYLNSVQMINWNSNMATIKKAQELTKGLTTDKAKVEKIYNYIVGNINYDYKKLNNLPSTYLPVIDDTLASKSGICYDFASLNAAMLRSIGIPAKLIMGYAEGVNGYHAWNEVYLEGKWVVMDTSYDSQIREAGGSYTMVKKAASYTKEKEY